MDNACNLAERPCGTLALLLSRPWKSVQKGGDPPLSWRRTVARRAGDSVCYQWLAGTGRDDRVTPRHAPTSAPGGHGAPTCNSCSRTACSTRTGGSSPGRSEVVAVGPQVFDLLVYLVRNREHVVSKDDLLDAVWDGRIVSESTLTSHINAVRKAIGDSGEEQRLIRTLARKGFRFVGEVEGNSIIG